MHLLVEESDGTISNFTAVADEGGEVVVSERLPATFPDQVVANGTSVDGADFTATFIA